MTASRDPDRLIHGFLLEGEEQLQDQVYDAVRAEIEDKQQRAVSGLWRTPTMNKFVTIGLGAAAVVVLLFVGSRLIGSSNVGGPGVEPTATPEASLAEPSSSADAFLPEGPLLVWESTHEDAPSITMTISAPGWIYNEELIDDQLAVWLEKGEGRDNMPEAAVLPDSLPPGTGFYVYGDPCQSASTRPETPATTVDDIVAALAAQASRDASEPVDVTVGGYAGKMITLHVPDDAAFAACDGGEFASYTIEGEERWQWHQGPGQIDDFWFLDVEGSIVTIRAAYLPDTPIELLEEMRTLVESATFDMR
jgi:hypothetical protein